MSDVERFNSPRLEMQLQEHVAKAELLLEEMKLIRALEKVESPMSETQLKEHVMKAELLPSQMEMVGGVENVDSPMLEMQMKEHTPKVGSVPENTKLVEEESKMESPVQLKEHERLLRELELEPESGELESLTFERELERHVEKLNLLLERKKV